MNRLRLRLEHDGAHHAEDRLPWCVFMSWQDLLFMHWKVPAHRVRALLPPAMELDLFEGGAWITMIPMHMVGVRLRGLPEATALSWPEINFRTYVRVGDEPGICFLSIDVDTWFASWSGEQWLLPMVRAEMGFFRDESGQCHLRSQREARGPFAPARFEARYRGVGRVREAEPGTLEHFHSERELMFMPTANGQVLRGKITHPPWPLQDAIAEIHHNDVPQALGLDLGAPDRLAYARRADTVAWPPVPQPS